MSLFPIHKILLQSKKKLCFAESITGGALSGRIVLNAGCSHYFLGSIVAYSKEAKKQLLSVSSMTIDSFGEVSEEVASEMSLGALLKFQSDIALAVTGIAGPSGATEKKPIGMVCFSLSSKDKDTQTVTLHFNGNRETIIENTIQAAFKMLYEYIHG